MTAIITTTRGRITVERNQGASVAAKTPYFSVTSSGFVDISHEGTHQCALLLSQDDLRDLREALDDVLGEPSRKGDVE